MLPLLPLLLPPTLPPLLVLALEGCCSCLLPSAPDRPQHWSQCLPKMLIRSALITETRKEANTERSRSEATRKHTTTSISTNHHGLCKTSVGHRTHTYKREKGKRERKRQTQTWKVRERENQTESTATCIRWPQIAVVRRFLVGVHSESFSFSLSATPYPLPCTVSTPALTHYAASSPLVRCPLLLLSDHCLFHCSFLLLQLQKISSSINFPHARALYSHSPPIVSLSLSSSSRELGNCQIRGEGERSEKMVSIAVLLKRQIIFLLIGKKRHSSDGSIGTTTTAATDCCCCCFSHHCVHCIPLFAAHCPTHRRCFSPQCPFHRFSLSLIHDQTPNSSRSSSVSAALTLCHHFWRPLCDRLCLG